METEQQQIYRFTQGYSNLHILQVHHLTLTFIIHNKYIYTLYIIYSYILRIVLITVINETPIITINIRYKLLGTYKERSR